MRRVSGSASSVANLMGARLVLSHASRQEFILAGGNGNHYGSQLVPGRALWQEQLAQIAVPTPGWAQAQAPASVATSLDFGTSGSFAVVAADPVAAAMQLRDRLSALGGDHEILELGPTFTPGGADLTVTIGGRPRVIIGSPESWQSLWGAIEAISAQWPVAIVGCTASEYRSVTRARALPPPLEKAPEYWWLVRPGLPVTRARFTPLTLDR
jgi:S-DNA-T family DNA segregation ATPase FtsK/SpoIIIE